MDSRRRALVLLLVIYLGFVSLGLPDGMLGVAWPAIYPDLRLPVGLAGTLLALATILTGTAAFASGAIIARFGTGRVVLASGLLTATGLLVVAHAENVWWLYAAVMPLGFGAGAVDAGLNGYVARHYSGRHMNWLHACWGIGATGGPFVVGWALAAGHGWRGGYLLVSSLQFTLAVLFLLTLGLWNKVPERTATEAGRKAPARPLLPAGSFAGWLSPAIFALYVAAEWTIGLWASTVLVARHGLAPDKAALCTAAYFGSLTVGRIGVGLVVERWGNRRVVNGGAWLATAGLAIFALADHMPLLVAALMLSGLGLAPIYPGLMHEVPRRFVPEAVQTIIGRQSGGASVGAALVPAIAGWIGGYSLGAIPWIALGVLLALVAGIRKLDRIS